MREAHKILNLKFSGYLLPQEIYMKRSVFKNIFKIIPNLLGVIFIHDFYDSPHSHGASIFTDFEDWLINTLEYFKKKKLEKKIGIRPHPNSHLISKKIEEKLKKLYPEFIWLNKDISNHQIFNSKILLGLSSYGTVLHELAYYNIPAVCVSDNPCMSFEFNIYAKTKKQYFKLINDCLKKKIKYPKNFRKQILEFTYMRYIHNNEMIKNFEPHKFKSINFRNNQWKKYFSNDIKIRNNSNNDFFQKFI